MKEIQLIRLLDAVDIREVTAAVGVSPRSVIIRGRDFRSVEQVLLNGFVAPEFVVYSSSELVAQVPAELALASITDVLVLSQNLTFTERSLVEFTFGTRPKTAEGTIRLMQTFLRILLRTPGSNLFHRNTGGGLNASVGGNLTPRNAADIHIAVGAARQQIIGAQAAQPELPASERLIGAEVVNISGNPRDTAIYATIVITSASGQRNGTTLNF